MRNHFIRSQYVEGQNFQRACTTKDKIAKELFNFEYCYDCKKLNIKRPVRFIAAPCFIGRFPLEIMSIVFCLNSYHLHYFQGTKSAVKIKE